MVHCAPDTSGTQLISIQAVITDVIAEPKIIAGPHFNSRRFGIGLLIIRILTFLAVIAVGCCVFGDVPIFGLYGIFAKIIWAVLGLIGIVIAHKILHWGWHNLNLFWATLTGSGDMSPRLLSRILSVKESSGNGRTLEAVLSSARHADIAMPKIGHHMEIQGFLRGRQIVVKSYRVASPF